MKKLAIYTFLIAFWTGGSFAQTADVPTPDTGDAEVSQEEGEEVKHWWNNGLQFGLGVPLMLPATGYNGFVGFVNKNSSSFWGKRFGGRLDFQIPSAMKASGTFKDNDTLDGYDLSAKASILFFDHKFDMEDIDYVEIDDDDDPLTPDVPVDLAGSRAKMSISNQNIGAILDFYPFGNTWFLGGIRLSGGYYIGEMEAKLSAVIPNTLPNSVNGMEFDVDGGNYLYARLRPNSRISGKVKWNYTGPYAGLGFDLGVFRGFKFYMDAGVVFTDAPRLRDEDFVLPTDQVELCYKASGSTTPCDWVRLDIDKGAPDLMGRALGSVIGEIIGAGTGAADQYGVNYDDINSYLPPEYQGASYDPRAVGGDLASYLTGGSVAWIDDLLADPAVAGTDFEQAITAIHNDPENNDLTGNELADIQQEINDAIDDYKKNRRDAINDSNDSLKEAKFVPMIKLGVMYRF